MVDSSGNNQPGIPSFFNPSQENNSASLSGKPTNKPSSLTNYGNIPNSGSSNIPDAGSSSLNRQPIRSNSYDSTPNSNADQSRFPGLNLPNTQDGILVPSFSQNLPNQNQPINSFNPSQSGVQYPLSTDVLAGLRNAFKLPPGLCLVQCDTLKPDQVSLTPAQIKDAFASSGLSGIQ